MEHEKNLAQEREEEIAAAYYALEGEGADNEAKIAALDAKLREQTQRADALRYEAEATDELTDELIETRAALAKAHQTIATKAEELEDVKSMWMSASERENAVEAQLEAAREAAEATAAFMAQRGNADAGPAESNIAQDETMLRLQQQKIAELQDQLEMESSQRYDLEEQMATIGRQNSMIGASLEDELSGLGGDGPNPTPAPVAAMATEETGSDDELPEGPVVSLVQLSAAEDAAVAAHAAREESARQAAAWEAAAAKEREAREASEKAAQQALSRIAEMEEKLRVAAAEQLEQAAIAAAASAAQIAGLQAAHEEKARQVAAAEASRQSSAAEAEALRVAAAATAKAQAEGEQRALEAHAQAAAAQAEIDRIAADAAAQKAAFDADREHAEMRREMLERLQRMFPSMTYMVMESVLTLNDDDFDQTVEMLKDSQQADEEAAARKLREAEDEKIAKATHAGMENTIQQEEQTRRARQNGIARQDSDIATRMHEAEAARVNLDAEQAEEIAARDAAYVADINAGRLLAPNEAAVAARVSAVQRRNSPNRSPRPHGGSGQVSTDGMSTEEIAALIMSGAISPHRTPRNIAPAPARAPRPPSGDYGFGGGAGAGAGAGADDSETNPFANTGAKTPDPSNPFAEPASSSNPFGEPTSAPLPTRSQPKPQPPVAGPPPPSAEPAAPSRIWICPQCTLHNELSDVKCGVCEFDRPPQKNQGPARVQQRHAGGGEDSLTDAQIARAARDSDAAEQHRRDVDLVDTMRATSRAGSSTSVSPTLIEEQERRARQHGIATVPSNRPAPMPHVPTNPQHATPYPSTAAPQSSAGAAAGQTAIINKERIFYTNLYDAVTLQWLGLDPRDKLGSAVYLKVTNLDISFLVESSQGGSGFQPFAAAETKKKVFQTIKACPIDRVLVIEESGKSVEMKLLDEHSRTQTLKFLPSNKDKPKEVVRFTKRRIAKSQQAPPRTSISPARSIPSTTSPSRQRQEQPLPTPPQSPDRLANISFKGKTTEEIASMLMAGALPSDGAYAGSEVDQRTAWTSPTPSPGAALSPTYSPMGGDIGSSSRTVTITRQPGQGLGLELLDQGARGTMIQGVVPEGVAAVAMCLPGETIVAINSQSLAGASHAAVIAALKGTGATFRMTTTPYVQPFNPPT
jgi:hypothetical protein